MEPAEKQDMKDNQMAMWSDKQLIYQSEMSCHMERIIEWVALHGLIISMYLEGREENCGQNSTRGYL